MKLTKEEAGKLIVDNWKLCFEVFHHNFSCHNCTHSILVPNKTERICINKNIFKDRNAHKTSIMVRQDFFCRAYIHGII